MAKLNEKQQRLLNTVRETHEQIMPSLRKLQEDYEYAVFRAQAPVIDAIRTAEVEGVPFKRITEEGMGFTYPMKLRQWIQPPESVVRRLMSTDVAVATSEVFENTVAEVRAVSRDSHTGEFTVTYQGNVFTVPSIGPDNEPWSSADPHTPQGVYDLIKQEYPTWELMEDDED